MVDAFTRLAEFMFSPIGILLMIIIIVGIVIYILIKRPGIAFQPKDITELNREDNSKKFKLFRTKVSGKIYNGMQLVGKYNSFVHEQFTEPKMNWSVKKGQLVPDPKNIVEYDHFTFRICKIPFLWIFGIGIHYLKLDNGAFTFKQEKKKTDIILKDHINPSPYAGIWISSEKHIDDAHNPCYKFLAESTMTQIANYPNRMVFYETAHAKAINRIKTKQEVKVKGFKEYKKAEAEDEETESES